MLLDEVTIRPSNPVLVGEVLEVIRRLAEEDDDDDRQPRDELRPRGGGCCGFMTAA